MIEECQSMESTQSVNFKTKQEKEKEKEEIESPSSSLTHHDNDNDNDSIEINNDDSIQDKNEYQQEEVKESQDPLEMKGMESRVSCNQQSIILASQNDNDDEDGVQHITVTDDIMQVDIHSSSTSILDSNLNLEHRLNQQDNIDKDTDSSACSNENVAAVDTNNIDNDDVTDKPENNDDDDNISYEEEEEEEEIEKVIQEEESMKQEKDVSANETETTTTTTTHSSTKIIDTTNAIPSSPPSPPEDTKYESPIKASTSNDTYSSTISAHMEIHSLKEFYEKKLHLQKQTHDQQIDEILHQLNHLESTYEGQLQDMKSNVTKTNIMNEALMNQLVVYKKNLEKETLAVETSQQQVQELQCSIEEIQSTHESQRLKWTSSKEDAIVQAREEIRLAAESQFAAAQKTFLKLKQDYLILKTEKQDVEKKFTLQKDKLAQLEKKDQNYTQEMNKVLAENAELQAKLATDNAETLKLKQTYLEKANSFVQKEQNMEERLEVLEKERKDAVRAYHVVVEEKDALKNENAELQALCEELMLIVEGNKGK